MVCDGGERYIHGPLVNELLGASGDLTPSGRALAPRRGDLSFRDVLASAPLQGLRLLVVEDDETILASLSDLLRDEGATLATAVNGRDALGGAARLGAARPHPPGSHDAGDGRLGVPRRPARRPALAGIPLIAMSADASAKARAIAADAYLRKPVDVRGLVASIRGVIDRAAPRSAGRPPTAPRRSR